MSQERGWREAGAEAGVGEALAGRLGALEWERGLTSAEIARGLSDRDDLARLVGQRLPEGPYFSPRDVLNALDLLPADAWSSGTAGGEGGGSAAARVADGSAATAAGVPVSAEERSGETASGSGVAAAGAASVPAGPDAGATGLASWRRAVPVALSALQEGLGQAYNRQPGKAVAFGATGLTLSTVSGLNTWLARRLLRSDRVRVGPERVRPVLLGLFAVTYLASLWDAWANAARRAESGGSSASANGWGMLRPARAGSAAAETDEYPIVRG